MSARALAGCAGALSCGRRPVGPRRANLRHCRAHPWQALLSELSALEVSLAEEGGSGAGSSAQQPAAAEPAPQASGSGGAPGGAGGVPRWEQPTQQAAALMQHLPSGRGNPFLTITGEVEEIEAAPSPAAAAGPSGRGARVPAAEWGEEEAEAEGSGSWTWARAKAAVSNCWDSTAVQVRALGPSARRAAGSRGCLAPANFPRGSAARGAPWRGSRAARPASQCPLPEGRAARAEPAGRPAVAACGRRRGRRASGVLALPRAPCAAARRSARGGGCGGRAGAARGDGGGGARTQRDGSGAARVPVTGASGRSRGPGLPARMLLLRTP
jgi:hypothetical protein